MVATLLSISSLSPASAALQLKDSIEYPEAGILSKVLVKDACCQYTLFCLAAGTEIAEHTSTRNATVHMLEGKGKLILNGHEISLEPDVFVMMPANVPHALKAEENLAFLLVLSEHAELKQQE
jgi:quercetin dioxygenase-like cupin family protein